MDDSLLFSSSLILIILAPFVLGPVLIRWISKFPRPVYVPYDASLHPLPPGLQACFLEKGFYLFRHERGFGIGGGRDRLGLLPTRDPYEIIRLLGTNGWNYDLGPEDVIARLREIERDQPFVLTGIGFDFVEGRFVTPIRDAGALARRLYKLCPDIVDQGAGSVDALAQELRETGTLFLWWD